MELAPTTWADEAPPPAWPVLDRDARCDVLVIGAGIAGLAIAGELRKRGADVLVLDEASPGAGASARNAGFVLVSHVWEHPGLRARIGGDAMRAMIAIARRTHSRIEEDFGESVGHRRCGSLMLPIAGDEAEAGALVAAATQLDEDGVPCELAAPPPSLAGFGRGLLVPEDGEVHPGALVAAMARSVARGAIARVEMLDGAVRVARTSSGRSISFGRAIVATNAWTRGLVPEVDGVILPQRAQVLLTAPVAMVLDRPCYATYGYDYFRQRSDGSVMLGGRRHLHRELEKTDDASTTEGVQTALDTFLREHVPFAHGAPIARRWAGIMGFTPDALPLVGPLPRAPETVSLLAGWSGHGLGLAIGCAERLARSIRGDGNAIPAALDPARFAAMQAR